MKTLLLFLYLATAATAANYYLVTQPLTAYTDSQGRPLQNGYIYFGVVNQNPITNPITMTWDAAGTIPAAQPLRTTNGYISRYGTPANIYAPSAYSIAVQDSTGSLVFNNPNSLVLSPQTAGSIGLVDAGNYYPGNENVESAFQVLGPLIAQIANAFSTNQFVPTGTMVPYCGATAPPGYVAADGNTIGMRALELQGRTRTLRPFSLCSGTRPIPASQPTRLFKAAAGVRPLAVRARPSTSAPTIAVFRFPTFKAA